MINFLILVAFSSVHEFSLDPFSEHVLSFAAIFRVKFQSGLITVTGAPLCVSSISDGCFFVSCLATSDYFWLRG